MDDEEGPNENEIQEDNHNQYQRINDMIIQKLQDQVENEPTPTIEEIQEEMNNELNNN
jgi:hypothetical protein